MTSTEPPEISVAEESGPRRLDRRVIAYWRLLVLTRTAALLGVLWVFDQFFPGWLPRESLVSAVLIGGTVLAFGYPPSLYRSWSFELLRGSLHVHRGVWAHTTSIVPHHRIQHVDTRRDPLERGLGIARVVVFTAGIRGAEITIPGIPAHEAETLRDRLAELGGAGEGV